MLRSVLSSSSTSAVSQSLVIVMESLMGIMVKRLLTSKLIIISVCSILISLSLVTKWEEFLTVGISVTNQGRKSFTEMF